MNPAKSQDTKISVQKSVVFLYMNNHQKRKLRNNFIYISVQRNKIFGNKVNKCETKNHTLNIKKKKHRGKKYEKTSIHGKTSCVHALEN